MRGFRSSSLCTALAPAAALACGLLSTSPALAVGTISAGGHVPLEQRVALAIGPDRTTLWTSVRVDANVGPVGVIAPAAPGASLDWSSSSWFEALEVATAPRVLAPPLDCRGEPPAADLHVAGEIGHEIPLPSGAVTVLPDGAAVAAWAAENGLTLPPAVADALAALSGQRFVAARFDAPAGVSLTPTLRVVSPVPVPELPLVLTRAGDEDLLVTTWVLGQGRAHLDGAPVAAVNLSDLTFHAKSGLSSYDEARAQALIAAGPGSSLIEAASHVALAGSVPLPNGAGSIDGLSDVYFERAAAYGDGLAGAHACAVEAAAALAGAAPLAASCPRAELGVVDGTASCTETVGAGEADPEALRCGPGADDLAVALSGQTPAETWLTRQSLLLPAGSGGARTGVSLPPGAEVSPVLTASSLVCEVPLRRVDSGGCSCSGTEETVIVGFIEFVVEDDEDEPPESYAQEEDCDGDTSDTYASDSEGEPVEEEDDGGGCGSDSSDSSDTSGEGDSEDDGGCGSDSSDTSADSGDDGGCGGDTTGTGEGGAGGDDTSSSSSGGDGDGGDEGDDGDDGGSSSEGCSCDGTDTETSSGSGGGSGGDSASGDSCQGDCSVAAPKRRVVKRVRLSVLLFAAAALIAPLRRALRPRRRGRQER